MFNHFRRTERIYSCRDDVYMQEHYEVDFIENRLVRVIGSSSGSCGDDIHIMIPLPHLSFRKLLTLGCDSMRACVIQSEIHSELIGSGD